MADNYEFVTDEQFMAVITDLHEEMKATEDVVESLCENTTDMAEHIGERDNVISKGFTGIFILQGIIIVSQIVIFVMHIVGG